MSQISNQIELRCFIYEEEILPKTEELNSALCKLQDMFRVLGDSVFADMLYARYYSLVDQYEEDCKYLDLLKHNN